MVVAATTRCRGCAFILLQIWNYITLYDRLMIQRSTLKRDSSEQLAVVHSAFCNMAASWWGWSSQVDQKQTRQAALIHELENQLNGLIDEVDEKSKQIDDLQHQLAKEALARKVMAEEISCMQSQLAEVCTRLQKAEGKLFDDGDNENGNYSKPDHGVEVEKEEHSAKGEDGSGTEEHSAEGEDGSGTEGEDGREQKEKMEECILA